MSTHPLLQLQQPERFEKTVLTSLAVGGAVGLVHHLGHRWLAPAAGFPSVEGRQLLPLSALVVVGTVLATLRGDRMDRLLIAGLGVVLPGLPWLLDLSPGWAAAFSASAG